MGERDKITASIMLFLSGSFFPPDRLDSTFVTQLTLFHWTDIIKRLNKKSSDFTDNTGIFGKHFVLRKIGNISLESKNVIRERFEKCNSHQMKKLS